MSGPSIISSARLLEIINGDTTEPMSRSAMYRLLMNDPRWRACIVASSGKKLWISVQKLTDTGIIRRPESPRVEAMPGLGFTYSTQGVG